MNKIKIDKEKCIGCGMCQSLCPDVFEMIEAKAQVKEQADFERDKECIENVINSCPAEAVEEIE